MNAIRTAIYTLIGLLTLWEVDGGYMHLRVPPCPDHNSSVDHRHGSDFDTDANEDDGPTTLTYAVDKTPSPLEEFSAGPPFEWRDPRDPDGDSIVGVAGKDYPILAYIYSTEFNCSSSPENQSIRYVADVQTRCQVFHVCLETGGHVSFLCPNGTMFNELYSVCDWWYNVDCGSDGGIGEDHGDATMTSATADGSFQETDLNGQAFTVAIPRINDQPEPEPALAAASPPLSPSPSPSTSSHV